MHLPGLPLAELDRPSGCLQQNKCKLTICWPLPGISLSALKISAH